MNQSSQMEAERVSSGSQLLWSSAEGRCRYISGKIHASSLYSDILSVRNHTDDRWPDQRTPVDQYSDQYCMYVDGTPVGSLGVTRALDGDIYLHEFCPPQLLDAFRETIVSAYRFRILPEFRRTASQVPGLSLSRYMTRESWREQIAKGAGLDVINIERTHAPLYARMGYVFCEGSEYLDPVLGTPSCLMFLPVDPDRPSVIQDIIRENDIRVSVLEVTRCLSRKQVYVNGFGS
jgi:hypothetical protein